MKFSFDKERKKQLVLTFIAFSLILVGYLNYGFDKKENDTIEVSSYTNDINLGDVQLVNSEPENTESAIVSNDSLIETVSENNNENDKSQKINDEITTVKDNYFEETRIERDRMYSEMLETYQKIVNNSETPADQKAIAIQEISNITNSKNGIMIAENLIKNKGFENVVILVNNGTVSVVVKSYSLNQEQISKIQNIVERELNVKVENINISSK